MWRSSIITLTVVRNAGLKTRLVSGNLLQVTLKVNYGLLKLISIMQSLAMMQTEVLELYELP